MVGSCTQLKGTMIVALILVENSRRAKQQNAQRRVDFCKGADYCNRMSWEMLHIIPTERDIWDTRVVPCLLWQQLSAIWDQSSYQMFFFVRCLLCVGVCCVCIFIPSQFKLDSPRSVCCVNICTNKSCPSVEASDKEDIIVLCTLSLNGLSVKYISLYVGLYLFARPIHLTRGSACHSLDVYVTLASSISL